MKIVFEIPPRTTPPPSVGWASWICFAALGGIALGGIAIAAAVGCQRRQAPAPESQQPEKTLAEAVGSPNSVEQVGNDSPPDYSHFSFVESASQAGLSFAYRNGEETEQFSILENLGGGVAVWDYDADGWPDLLFAGGGYIGQDQTISGRPYGLFRSGAGRFSSVASSAHFSPTSRYSHGVTISDIDNDGFDDALVTGYGGVDLLLNQGDGTFLSVMSDALRQVSGIATSVAAGDFNGDAAVDLYVVTYVDWSFDNHPFCPAPSGDLRELCSPKEFSGTQDYLFYGRGDGTFELANDRAGLRADGKGLGILAVDVDHDGDTDLYVANDTTDNFLYLNDGQGAFAEVGMLNGVALDERALPNGSMGLTACDINGDLQVDLWVANYERESFALYRNEGNAHFLHTSRRYGISALGGMYVGFGTDWEDFDRDGQEEIVVTNGHVLKYPTSVPRRQRPLLLARDDSRFVLQEFEPENYFSGQYEGRGLAVGDVDRDGQQDVIISHINENVALLLNRTPPEGDYLRVRLVGTRSARNAVGAHLTLETSTGPQLRSVVGGGSYLSYNERAAFFGVPSGASLQSLTIHWPSGTLQKVDHFPDSEMLIVEPQDAPSAP